MDSPEGNMERVVLCRKNNKPCSKPKGHPAKCDNKRKLESQEQFWLKSPCFSRRPESGKENVSYTTPHKQPKPTEAVLLCRSQGINQETLVTEMSNTSVQPVLFGSVTPTRIPLGEYRPCVQEKRKGEVEQLFMKKQQLEAEVLSLRQESAAWQTKVQRFQKEAVAWNEKQIDLVRRIEQVSQDEEKLRQEAERLSTWEKDLEALNEKVRKVLEHKGQYRTRVKDNPTTIGMMSSHTDTWYKRRRLSRECLEVVNGGSDGAVVAAFGVMVEIASYDQIDKLMTSHKKGKFYNLKFNSVTAKFEASADNLQRSLAAKFNSDLSRRKYQLHHKTISSVYDPTKKVYLPRNSYIDGVSFRQSRLVSSSKLQAAIDSIDIGDVHSVPGTVGAMRPLVSLVYMIVDLWLRVPELRSELRWFQGRENHFIFLFADDGTPETRDSGMIVGTLSCLNFGKKVRSPETQYLLHMANTSEKSEVGKFIWGQNTEQAEWLESRAYTVNGELCTFEFRAGGDESWAATALGETTGAATYPSPWANVSKSNMFTVGGKIGQTWQPWTMEQRYTDAKRVEEFVSSQPAGLSETVLRNRRNSFMAENGIRAICSPPIGKYAATFGPEPLHVECNAAGHLVNVVYQEAVKRDCVDKIIAVLKAPISLPKARNESDPGRYQGKPSSTVSLEAAADRVRQNEEFAEQCVNLHRNLDASEITSDPGKQPALVGLNMKAVADKILEHDANKASRHTKIKNLRLIGENAICLERYFHRLVDALAVPNEGEQGKVRRHVIGKLGQLQRDAASLFNQHETDEAQLNELEEILRTYYNLYCLFLPESGSLVVWTMSQAIPYHAWKLYDEYGVGYGVVSMQGKESKNAKVKDYLKLTNRSKDEGKTNKFFQVFRNEYIKNFYLPEHNPSPSRYRPHFNPRVPSQVGTPGFCDCGREIVRSDVDRVEDEDEEQVSLCTFCLESLEVLACAKEGELSQKMLGIMLPAVCEVAHVAAGEQTNHLANEVSASASAVMVPQTMNKQELTAELRKRGKSTAGNLQTLRVRLEKALRPRWNLEVATNVK